MFTNPISYVGNFFKENIYPTKNLREQGPIVVALTATVFLGALAYGNHLFSQYNIKKLEALGQKMNPPFGEILLAVLKMQLLFALVIGSLVGIFAWLSCPIPYGIVGLMSLGIFFISLPLAENELILERLKEK